MLRRWWRHRILVVWEIQNLAPVRVLPSSSSPTSEKRPSRRRRLTGMNGSASIDCEAKGWVLRILPARLHISR
jgi:hypothetical protein